MSKFVPLLTAATLLIHLVIGCCWHHSHAVANEANSSIVAPSCPHHAHSASEEPARSSSSDPSESDRCNEERCVVIPSDISLAPVPWHLLPQWCMPQPSLRFARSAWREDAAADPSVERCLTLVELHQVLLI